MQLLATGSATLVPTQGAVKTYVDAQVTAQDLDITTDSGTIDLDLDSDTLVGWWIGTYNSSGNRYNGYV